MASKPVLKDYYLHWLTYQTGLADQDHTSTGNYISYTNTKTGGWNPNWKQDIAEHRSAGTPFSGELFDWQGSTRGSARTSFYGKANPSLKLGEKVNGDIISPDDLGAINLPGNVPMKTRVVNAAVAKFYQEAWSALRQFQGGVFLGELRETLNMIRHPAKSIRRLVDVYSSDVRRRIKRVRRGRPSTSPVYISDANKVASDTWLEYSFGLRPLMSDVKSGAEALARLALEPHEYKKVHVETDETYSVLPNPPFYIRNIATFTQYRFSRRRESGYSCWITGEVKCAVANPYLMRKEVLGFSPGDFAPTIYELIPYSFLVDYFSNIGDVIAAWSFPQGSLAWINRSVLEFANREVQAWPSGSFNPNPGAWVEESNDGSRLRCFQLKTLVQRDQGPLGLPHVTFEIPGSSTKWLNIGALAHMRRA